MAMCASFCFVLGERTHLCTEVKGLSRRTKKLGGAGRSWEEVDRCGLGVCVKRICVSRICVSVCVSGVGISVVALCVRQWERVEGRRWCARKQHGLWQLEGGWRCEGGRK